MIFGIRQMISFLSRGVTLMPGDVIFTGTPEGVAMGRKPQVWLKDGDVVEVGLEGVGTWYVMITFPGLCICGNDGCDADQVLVSCLLVRTRWSLKLPRLNFEVVLRSSSNIRNNKSITNSSGVCQVKLRKHGDGPILASDMMITTNVEEFISY